MIPVLRKLGSLQEVNNVSIFFDETNLEFPFQQQDEITKKLIEKSSHKKR